MNRAEKRHQRKNAQNAAKNAMHGQATDHSFVQQTKALRKTLDLAIQYHTTGDLPKAEVIYQEILQANPNHPDALHLLGVLAHETGKNDIAVDLITRAVAIKPDDVEGNYNLGNALQEVGNLEQAVTSYRKSLTLKPDYAEAHNNLGVALQDLGKLDEAVANYTRALAVKPDYAEAHNNFGNVLQERGKLEDAVVCYHKALVINSDYAEAHSNLGNTFRSLGNLEEAVACYHQALAIKPDNTGVYGNLGNAFLDLGNLENAVANYHKALAIEPDNFEVYCNLGNAFLGLGRLEDAVASYREALAIKPDYAEAGRNLLYVMLNIPGLSQEELFTEHLRFSENHARDIPRPAENFTNEPTPDRRLRVGYLSSDFLNHSVGRNILPLLSFHDRGKFKIFCYADVQRPDGITEICRSNVDHWHTIVGKSDAEVARMVRSDRIDVLICLAGRFDKNRPLVCAHRAAPVQVSYHDGATSGLKEMDYFLTDTFLNPPDTKELFTEELHRLPVFYQYPPLEEAPPVGSPPSAQTGYITFGSFNNPAKINDEVIHLWSKVLKSVPDSQLFLKYKNWYAQTSLSNKLVEKFGTYGIGEDRVLFATSFDTVKEHLGGYSEVDIALDPFPFNGATTTFQALWMGVPVISLAGETFNCRIAGSILHHLNLGDMVADTPEAYVTCAHNLAEAPARLEGLRANLREQIFTSPLCDAPTYARSVETAYRDMWRKWCTQTKTP